MNTFKYLYQYHDKNTPTYILYDPNNSRYYIIIEHEYF